MRPRNWDDEDEAPTATGALAEARALRELRAIYRQADAAYAPFSCPASGECCQLARAQRQPWLWYPEWKLLASRHPLPPRRKDGGCPYLDAAGRRCTVYADRPLAAVPSSASGSAAPPANPLTRWTRCCGGSRPCRSA